MTSFADRLLDRGAGLAPAHAAAPAPRRPAAVAPLEIDAEGDTIVEWRDYCDDWMRDYRPADSERALT